ncbi:MAG: hypothetical protein GY835_12945 [bacterium]|nr:hypothetical protein [bacterium]
MISNPVIDAMMKRASLRAYRDEMPSDEVIETVARAGQQAPFAFQCCSMILKRSGKHPWGAPINFIICADTHRMRLIAEKRGKEIRMNDLTLLLFAMQDAAYMAQNMVIAAESLGMGSCYIGSAPFQARKLIESCQLPKGVFPLVMLVMGYPAEEKPPRPRYPLRFSLFEDVYPELSDADIDEAMQRMDEGYLAQDYYRGNNNRIRLEEGEDTVPDGEYSWTEHISRKMQWEPDQASMLSKLRACGFDLGDVEAGDTSPRE